MSTREAVLGHVAASNAHDIDRVLAGLHPDVVRATGTDVFRGVAELRDEVLDDGLWSLRSGLVVRTLLVDGGAVAPARDPRRGRRAPRVRHRPAGVVTGVAAHP